MIVDLNPMPYNKAIEIIHWCFEHEIDKEKSTELYNALSVVPVPDTEWSLDIPEKYVTMFALKWSK